MVEPDYYNRSGLSPIQAFEQGLISVDEYIGFCKGNVIKYTVRAGEKTDDPLMDIIKAMDYLHYLHQALKLRKEQVIIPDDNSIDDWEDSLENLKDDINRFKKDFKIRPDSNSKINIEDNGYNMNEVIEDTPKVDEGYYNLEDYKKVEAERENWWSKFRSIMNNR